MYTVLSVLVSDFVRGSVPILNSVYLERKIVLVEYDLHYMICYFGVGFQTAVHAFPLAVMSLSVGVIYEPKNSKSSVSTCCYQVSQAHHVD